SSLEAKGFGRGSFVGVWLKRGLALHATIFGIVKSGAAYVPMDHQMPKERVEIVLKEVEASAYFSDENLIEGIRFPTPLFVRDAVIPERKSGPSPEDIAYVLYTSGSTGKPKGIPIQHRQISHFIRSENSILEVGSSDLVYQGFSVSFDMWCEETWISYLVGATLWVADEVISKSFDDLSETLSRAGVTVLHAVPSLLAVMDAPIPSLRLINAGGEACPESVFERWASPTLRFYNTYGPTETTVSASIQLLKKGSSVTIGKPLPNYGMAIVDAEWKVVPLGERGELVISGEGVSVGYIRRPDLTADRFVKKPISLSDLPGESIYRTGDEARMLENGEIEFLGRLDDQIKIRGYRIEMGEIEGELAALSGVLASCVVVAKSNLGAPRLIGFVVLNEGTVWSESLTREILLFRLPSYMVPEKILILKSMPRLASGKIDRKRLVLEFIPPERLELEDGSLILPQSIEERITWALQRIFPHQIIDLSKDFFDDLGGHSLLASHLVSLLREKAGIAEASIKDLYLNRPLSTLATKWGNASSDLVGVKEAFSKVDPRRHFWCGIAQVIALPWIFGLYAIQIFFPYLTYYYILQETERHGISIFAAVVMFCLMSPL
ncbi:MAG: non-ribosomal peptide synthetase, partial [Verrucomicrobiota bacterium]